MSSIELQNVTFRYALGGVSGLSFTVRHGQIACLLGPSGSGKTTVLKLLGGFLKPQEGQILMGGEVMAGSRFVPPQQRHIGLVFQQHALFPHFTVAQNILFGCREPDAVARTALLDGLLASFHIARHQHRYPHHISGGEQQRVAIARAMASAPRLLLMDEPFSSLDKNLREQVRQECVEVIRARGLTTLIVTHDEEEASLLADQIIRLPSF